MRKIAIVVFSLILMLTVLGCTDAGQRKTEQEAASIENSQSIANEEKKENNEDKQNDLETVLKQLEGIRYKACEDVIDDINNDVNQSLKEIEDRYNAVMSEIDDTYESYSQQEAALYEWYDFTQKEAEKVYSMLVERSKVYYMLLAVTVGPENVFSPTDRMIKLHMPVYTAFDDIWMSIYMKNSEIWNKLYPVLNTHGDDLKKLKDTREPFLDAVKEYKTAYYTQYQETYDKVYKGFQNGEINIVKYFD